MTYSWIPVVSCLVLLCSNQFQNLKELAHAVDDSHAFLLDISDSFFFL